MIISNLIRQFGHYTIIVLLWPPETLNMIMNSVDNQREIGRPVWKDCCWTFDLDFKFRKTIFERMQVKRGLSYKSLIKKKFRIKFKERKNSFTCKRIVAWEKAVCVSERQQWSGSKAGKWRENMQKQSVSQKSVNRSAINSIHIQLD